MVVKYTLNAYKNIGVGKFFSMFRDEMETVRPIVFERIGRIIEEKGELVEVIVQVIYSLGGTLKWETHKKSFTELTCEQPPS